MSKVSKQNNNIYAKVLLSDKLLLEYSKVNNNLHNVLENIIKNKIEGMCIDEGYVKNNSTKLISYSSGELFANNVLFTVTYECLVTIPVESMNLECLVKSITKVGIRAELNESISPYIIFIARDHHYNNELFSKINIGDIINVRVIGQRFELNDKFISVIAELLDANNYETTKAELQQTPIEGGQKIRLKIKSSKKLSANKN